jgi:hypothetical protein
MDTYDMDTDEMDTDAMDTDDMDTGAMDTGAMDTDDIDTGTMDTGAAHARRTATERTCVVTRRQEAVGALIRFVLDPDGAVTADVKRRLPGRGVWVTARRTAVAEAVRKRLFARAFKAQVKVAADLPDRVARLLEQSALDALSIARKAGLVVQGFAKVEAAVASSAPPPVALIRARDAGEDGGRRLAHAFIRRTAADRAKIVQAFTSAQLDLALGRLNVVHAALLAGRASEAFLVRWRFLEDFRADEPVSEAPVAGAPASEGPASSPASSRQQQHWNQDR